MKHKFSNPALLLLVFFMACFTTSAVAADATTPPQITMFYPGHNAESPMTLFAGTKAYVYFETGSKIVSAKGRVLQDGVLKGDCTYSGNAVPNNVASMKTDDPAQYNVNDLMPGIFNIDICEVTYIVDGVEYTYTADPANPLGSVTYREVAANGTVVAESGIADGIFKSYYDVDDPDGVVTFTFSKAISADANVQAFVEYGQGDQYLIHDVPFSVAADRMSVSIDLRGVSRTVDDLAPGVTFVNEQGAPVPPPTDISLNVTGLTCDDGTFIEYLSYSHFGDYSTLLKGSIYKSYDYEDLGFPTPVISNVQFYDKANPSQRFNSINASTDMMDLYVMHGQYIAKADMVIESAGVSVTIPDADIVKSNSCLTVALPAEIIAAGSEDMVIKLENVEYTIDDGSTHVIKPFYTANMMREVRTIAELKTLDANEKVVLSVPDGIIVTLSNDQGYTFVQDATAGMLFITEDYTQVFGHSMLVTGRIVGTYMGYGTFMVDKKASDYDESVTDVSKGEIITSLDQLAGGDYDSRLVTIVASSLMPIAVDVSDFIMVDGVLPVITDFVEGFEIPETIVNVTGVYFNDPSVAQPCLLMRSMADFNQNILEGITAIDAAGATVQASDVYDLRGVKVRSAGESLSGLRGIFVIDGHKTFIK